MKTSLWLAERRVRKTSASRHVEPFVSSSEPRHRLSYFISSIVSSSQLQPFLVFILSICANRCIFMSSMELITYIPTYRSSCCMSSCSSVVVLFSIPSLLLPYPETSPSTAKMYMHLLVIHARLVLAPRARRSTLNALVGHGSDVPSSTRGRNSPTVDELLPLWKIP